MKPAEHRKRGDGRIALVATPIGNLGDISRRATEVLASADRIACEDTRRTGKLLEHLGIGAPKLVRVDEHTERAVAGALAKAATRGEVIAVVTDAGTPGMSDPGAEVVSAALRSGVPVEVVPGPFAGVSAAVLSGLLDGAGRFRFEGFLPRKGRARTERLAEIAASPVPVVLYESPQRVARLIDDLVIECGPRRQVSLSRELTKLHEHTWRGTLAEAVAHLADQAPRGEHVVVLAAAPPRTEPSDDEVREAIEERIFEGRSRRDAAADVATALGVAPNRAKGLATPAP